MSAAERRRYRHLPVPGLVPGEAVLRMAAQTAVRRFRPDVVVVAWAPPGRLVDRLRATPTTWVIEIGTDGNECGRGPSSWRLAEALLDGPVESLALCRVDDGRSPPRTRVTLYTGARAPRGGSPASPRRPRALRTGRPPTR